MNKEQLKAWKAAEKAASAARKKLLDDTRARVIDLLAVARDQIAVILAGAPTEYQQWRLTALQAEIGRVLEAFDQGASTAMSNGMDAAWAGGQTMIDGPSEAIGLRLMLPQLDTQQLLAMRSFTVDRIKNITTVAAEKIKTEMGLAMIGSQSINDTIGNVAQHLGETSRARAKTIVGDGLSTAWATAAEERAAQSTEAGVAMQKTWRRSGKIHSRLAHDLADGRTIPIDQAFIINGHKIRYPHDPRAPLSEIINCGCLALYRPSDAVSTLPLKRPFTADELALNPNKQQLANGPTLPQLLAK